jgi:hypothetical protein
MDISENTAGILLKALSVNLLVGINIKSIELPSNY